MGIQINGQTDTISASDGGLAVSGYELTGPSNINVTGIVTATTFNGDVKVATGSTISGGTNFITASTNGSERIRIDSSGNIGVRTITPSYPLQVETTGTGTSAGDNTSILIQSQADGRDCNIRFGDSVNASARIGYLSNNLYCYVNGQERARIDSSGNFGLGTQTFDSTASGRQILELNGSASSLINLDTSGVRRAYIFTDTSQTYFVNTQVGPLILGTSDTARARIDSDGRFNFLSGSSAVMYAASALAAGTSNYIFLGSYAATSFSGGVACYALYTNGSYQQLSDVNLKKNIETTRDGYLEDLNKFRVVKYNWKDQDDTESRELGLIAQEVEQIFPGLVSEMGEEGQPSYKGIRTSVLPYMLIKALQEATARIETLEANNVSLEAKVTALETQNASFEARLAALEAQ